MSIISEVVSSNISVLASGFVGQSNDEKRAEGGSSLEVISASRGCLHRIRKGHQLCQILELGFKLCRNSLLI